MITTLQSRDKGFILTGAGKVNIKNNFSHHHLAQFILIFFSYSEIMRILLELLKQFINYLVLHFSNSFADNTFYACVIACKLLLSL